MKPDWCPADIWETAGMWLVGRAHLEPSDREWVALAIFNERERCANLVAYTLETCRDGNSTGDAEDAWVAVIEHIGVGIVGGVVA